MSVCIYVCAHMHKCVFVCVQLCICIYSYMHMLVMCDSKESYSTIQQELYSS